MLTTADLEFFAAIARSRSLADAARLLDVTPPAVTQRLQVLEQRVGVKLVDRASRGISLTDEGELLATTGQAISDEIAALSETLAARRAAVAGHLRVLAPLGFGRHYIAPIASGFCAEYREVTLDLVLSDRVGPASEQSFDIVIHIGELRDSSQVAQKLAPNDRFVCASPAFVARHGMPLQPSDLRDFPCIALRENDEDVTLWRFARAGTETAVRIEPRLASNDGDVVRSWAIAGHGIIARSEWSVHKDLEEGRLVKLLDNYTMKPADVVALVGERRGRSARTSRFLQHLKTAMSPAPWRIES